MDFDSLKWTLADGEYDDRPLLMRFRQFPETFPKTKYPERINIFWKMSQTDVNGLPADEEFDRLTTFEDRLVAAVEPDEHSILGAVLTCNGQTEYVFHTADVSEFLQRLTNMPQEKEKYPITIHRYNDPEWKYFQSVIAQVQT